MNEEAVFQFPTFAWVLGASTFCWMFLSFTLILTRPGPLGEAEDQNAISLWRFRVFILSFFGSFVVSLPTLFIFPSLFERLLDQSPKQSVAVIEDILVLVPALAIFFCGLMGSLFTILVVIPREYTNAESQEDALFSSNAGPTNL